MEHDGNIAAAETIEAPPPSSTDIMTAIGQMRAEISDMRGEISNIRTAIHDDVIVRVEGMERIIETLPTVYASADSLNKVKSSQEEYEQSRRALTKQFADMANVQADNQQKFTSIEARLNDLSTVKTTVGSMKNTIDSLNDIMHTFMDNQRERLDNHDARLINNDRFVRELSGEVRFVKTTQEDAERRFITDYSPVRDYVLGSPTQESMKAVIGKVASEVHELRSSVSQQSAEYAIALDYVKTQKVKDENRRDFWRRVRLQMWTPRGLIAMLIVLVGMIMIMNAFSLDQLIARIQQAVGLYQALQSSK